MNRTKLIVLLLVMDAVDALVCTNINVIKGASVFMVYTNDAE